MSAWTPEPPVIVTMGASCSGKTSWARKSRSSVVLSFDDYLENADDPARDVNVAATQRFIADIGDALEHRHDRPLILDQHSLDPLARAIARDLAAAVDRPAILVPFEQPLHELRRRARTLDGGGAGARSRADRVEHTYRLMVTQAPQAIAERWDAVRSPGRLVAP